MVAVLCFAFAFTATAAFAALTMTTTTVSSDAALTLTGAATSAWSLSAGDLTVSAAAGAVNLTATGATAGDMAFTVGDDFTVNGAATSLYNIGAATTSGTIIIGGTAQTGLISLGDTASTTVTEISIGGGDGIKTAINIGDGAGANGINIGGAASNIVLTDAQWSVTGAGIGTLVNLLVSPSATTGVDVGSAGALSVGRVNATTVVIGSAATTSLTVAASTTGTAVVVLPAGSIDSTEVLDDTLTASDLAATVTFADGDVVDLSATVTTTAAAKGLKLPQKTDCSLGITEGFICWDTDNNVLYVGDAATAVTMSGSTGGVNTWTDNQIFTFVGDEDIAIASTAATITSGIFGLTVAAGDAAVDGINVSLTQNDGATATVLATGLEMLLTGNDATGTMKGLTITAGSTANSGAGTYLAGIVIDNADTTAASMTDAIIITSSGVNEGVTDAIDVSATNILNAINIGANPIVTGNVAGTIGDATTDSWTLTTDGTGTGEVVLSANSIGSPELTAGAKTHTVVIPVPDPGGAGVDGVAAYILWTPSVNVTITKVYTAAETAWIGAASANDSTVTVVNAAVGNVASLNVVTALAAGTNTDMGSITNGAVVAGTNVTLTLVVNGTSDAPRQNIQIEYTTTD